MRLVVVEDQNNALVVSEGIRGYCASDTLKELGHLGLVSSLGKAEDSER